MRSLVRLTVWIGCAAAAWLVVAGPPASWPEPGGVPGADGGGSPLADRRARVRVPPAPDRAAWRVHPSIHSAAEAASLGEGWVVLDTRSSRLHFLDGALELVRSVGGEGNGPGELARPMELAVLGDSLVAVQDAAGSRLDLFSAEGDALGRLVPRVRGCPVGLGRELVPDPAGGFVLQGLCPGAEARWTAVRLTLDGRTTVLVSASPGAAGRVVASLGRAVVAWRGRLWAGSPDGCFSPVPPADGETAVCLPADDPVPLPDSVRAFLTERGGVPDGALPEHWPSFVGASWSAVGPVLTLPGGGPGGTVALLRDDGTLVVLDAEERVAPGRPGLLVSRPFLEGTGLRLVPWPGPSPVER